MVGCEVQRQGDGQLAFVAVNPDQLRLGAFMGAMDCWLPRVCYGFFAEWRPACGRCEDAEPCRAGRPGGSQRVSRGA